MILSAQPQPFRVLHVVTLMHRGGGLEAMLMNYYRHMDRSKIQFDFLVHRAERGAFHDEIETMGGKIFQMPPIHPRYFFQYHSALNSFFHEHNEYTIVHSHLDSLSTFVLHAAKQHDIPVRIAHCHSTDFYDVGLRRFLKYCSRAQLKAQCTHYFACSKKAGIFLYGQKLVDEGKLTVLNNAISTKEYTFRPELRRRKRHEMDLDNALVIGHVGRFTTVKNHSFLLDVFNEIVTLRPNAKLLLVGYGELRSAMEEKVTALGLRDKVIFTGIRSDINELMMAMDLFLLPSLYEGFPVTGIEAQCTGLPVLLADTITPEAALTPHAFFMPLSRSAHEWAEKALSMISDVSGYDRTQGALDVAAKGYDIESCARQLQNFYLRFTEKEKGK